MTRSEPNTTSRRRPASRWLAAIAAGGALLIALAVVVVQLTGGSETISIVVPAGTQARIDAGEEIELIPALLEVERGDRIVVVNNDDSSHQVGPYVVGPNQTIEQQFTYAGRIEGICTLHPSGEVAIVVR